MADQSKNEIRVASAEEAQQLAQAFSQVALQAVLAAVPVNRFLLTLNPHGAGLVVVVGNAALFEGTGLPKTAFTNVVGAFSFQKNIAEDLVVTLERGFAITEADRKAAYDRNPLPPGSG